MNYRVMTVNNNGERRTVEYNSRRAALNHFSQAANSRYIIGASLDKWNAEDHEWENAANMEVTQIAAAVAQDARANG